MDDVPYEVVPTGTSETSGEVQPYTGGVPKDPYNAFRDEIEEQLYGPIVTEQYSLAVNTRTHGAHEANRLQPGERFSVKIPPSWDGGRSYFSYEKDVKEWTSMTTIEPRCRGPLLKNRIAGTQVFIK